MTAPRHTWVPYVAAASGAALVVSATLDLATRGELSSTAFVIPYLTGIALAIAAAIGTGLRRSSTPQRVGVAAALTLGVVAWIMAVGDALGPVVELVSKAEYVTENVPIAALGIVVLVAAYRGYGRDRTARP
jgi:hypothetical protein